MSAMRRIAPIELLVTTLCLIVVLTVPWFFGPARYWQSAAVTAAIVIVGHGLFFWTLRRRQEQRDAALIAGLRQMLRDRVNNQLQVVFDKAIQLRMHSEGNGGDPIAEQIAEIFAATREVARTLDELSMQKYESWRERYGLSSTAPGSGRPPIR